MKFKMDLLENSYDFLYDSLEFYYIADEHGTHDQERTDLNKKKKWKVAFIFLVQVTELLIKEGLFSINPSLILENIDNPNIDQRRTVSYLKSISRLLNLKGAIITEEEKRFLGNCANVRNSFIHYKVEFETPELKSKYSKLFGLYNKMHEEIVKVEILLPDEKQAEIKVQLLEFEEKYVVFRGQEFKKNWLQQLKRELEFNSKLGYFKNEEGHLIPRVKYGEEKDLYMKRGLTSESEFFLELEYCGDCCAQAGEYHLDGCDLEICPLCYGHM